MAEEPTGEFLDHLSEWCKEFDLKKKNYEGSIKFGAETLQGAIAKNAGITEVSLGKLGRAQLSEKK